MDARPSRGRDVARAALRYRPYLVLVIAVLLIVSVPATRHATKPKSRAAPTVTNDAAAPLAGGQETASTAAASPVASAPSPSLPLTGAARATAAVAPAAKSGLKATATAHAASAAAAAASASAFPGIGTTAATANPNCDPSTGRIKFPSRYAPPCVAPWPMGADNGGATSPGVTADTIKLAWYIPSDATNPGALKQDILDEVNVFNKHFEMWGRHVQVVFYDGTGTDEVSQRADAIKVATQIKPFLSTTANNSVRTYSTELAARGIVNFDNNVSWKDTQLQAPYRWGVQNDDRTTVMHVAEYAGKRLLNRPAQWAGDATMKTKPRVFGVVYPDAWDKGFMDSEFARNKVQPVDAITFTQGDVAGAQERARTIISKLKADNVTTVVDGGDYLFNAVITKEATTQLYQPEWMITGWGFDDVVLFARLNDQQQWAHAFGPGPIQVLPPPDNFESGAGPGSLYYWQYGDSKKPGSTANIGAAWSSVYLFFPCLQLAGPNLTPQTFRDGCFAYPPSGGSYQGYTGYIGASFGTKRPSTPWADYTGWDDMNEKWWDPNQSGPDEGGLTPAGGYYMKSDGGRRYSPGGWPSTAPKAFDPNGAIAMSTGYAANEKPPDYANNNPG